MKFFYFTVAAALFCASISLPATEVQKKAAARQPKAKTSAAAAATRPAVKRKPPARVLISHCSPDQKDATAAFVKALRTGTRKIIFDRPGCYFMRPVNLRRHLEIVLADGVTIRALPPIANKNKKVVPLPALFNGKNLRDIIFSGQGDSRICGRPGSKIFDFTRSSNLNFKNLLLTGGKTAAAFTGSSGIRFNDITLDDFSENGIELNSCSWLNFQTLQLRNVTGSAIAIKTDRFGRIPSGNLYNLEIYNSSCGITVSLPSKIAQLIKKSPEKYKPPVLTIRSCRFFRNAKWDICLPGEMHSGKVVIDLCKFTNRQNCSLKLKNFTDDQNRIKVYISHCTFAPEAGSNIPPLRISSLLPMPLGNIEIKNSSVKLPVNRQAVEFKLNKPAGAVSGVLQLISPDGEVKNVNLNATKEQ